MVLINAIPVLFVQRIRVFSLRRGGAVYAVYVAMMLAKASEEALSYDESCARFFLS